LTAELGPTLFSQEQIVRRVGELAREVTARMAGKDFLVLSVLKGSCIFAADLVRRIPVPLELGFAAVESYRGETEAGELAVHYFPRASEIHDRHVLLVDDILDTGRTLERLEVELRERGAREVLTCVLLDKPARRVASREADFRGFEVPDVFVVGYGLDHAGRYRNLPHIAALATAAEPALHGADGARSDASPGRG